MTTLLGGSSFAGRYRVVGLIGAGGMGAVYEVVHLETERRRALKVMHPHVADSADLRDRFKREARVAAQIDSEFVVDVFDAGFDEATSMPFLVMELLRGEELGKRIRRLGKLAPADALTFLSQASLALDKSHLAEIVHRDLKPENLFVNEREDGSERLKILDFGIAKFVAETGSMAAGTKSLGTPLYMAPEQFLAEPVSAASDTYAIALVAYTMLVGEAYWEREARAHSNVVGFALVASRGPVEPASARAAARGVTLPPGFDAWFARATAARVQDRFALTSELCDGLATALGLPCPVRPGKAARAAANDGPASVVNPHGETQAATEPPRTPTAIDRGNAPGATDSVFVQGSAPPARKPVPPSAEPNGTRPVAPGVVVLAAIGALAILGAGIFGVTRLTSSEAPCESAVEMGMAMSPSGMPSMARPPSVPPSASAAAVPTASATTTPSAAPPATESATASAPSAPAPHEWHKRGIQCMAHEGTNICIYCCDQPGDRLGPFPDCECLFDWTEWQAGRGR